MARVARVYPSGFSSILAIGMAGVFVIIGVGMLANGLGFGLLFILLSAGTAVYHFANLKGHAVPHFEEAVLPPDTDATAEDRLEVLHGWHQDGLVTDEEYEAKRKEILDRL